MEKQILTEIRRIREMMNLSLLTEQKDELYNLLIKLGREGENEAEKIEIRNALKKQGFSDVEIRTIAAGGDNILDNAVRRLEQKVSTQGLGDLEGILIKQGISKDAIASLPDGAYFIDGVEGLYTRKKNGLITDAEYQNKLNDVINALSDVANAEELKRAIKSIELDVDKQIDKKIVPETIPTDRPLNRDEILTNPELNSTLEDIVGTEIAKKARKEFEGMSDSQLINLYNELKRGLIRDDEMKKRISEAFTKNPSLWSKWKKLKNWEKAVFIPTVLFGTLFTIAYVKNRGIGGLIEDTQNLWNFIDEKTKTGEEKEIIKTQEEIANYLQRLENYRVLLIEGKKLSDVNNFYLNQLIGDFGTTQNKLKDTIPKKIKSLVDGKKLSDTYGMYQFGVEISNEINIILKSVDETKNFKVELIKETDKDYLKPGVQTTLKSLKDFLVIPDVKTRQKIEDRQKASYEQPKQKTIYPSNL
jgi:hypothetical protein